MGHDLFWICREHSCLSQFSSSFGLSDLDEGDQISNLWELSLASDFLFGGVVCVWAVGFVCLFVGWWFYLGCFTGFFLICTDWSWLGLKFSQVQVLQLFLEFWPIIRFQLDQFLHESSITVNFIGCIHPPYNGRIAVFAHLGTDYFPCFQEKHISLVFHLMYLFFFFVGFPRSCVSRLILSAVRTSNYLQATFLHMV